MKFEDLQTYLKNKYDCNLEDHYEPLCNYIKLLFVDNVIPSESDLHECCALKYVILGLYYEIHKQGDLAEKNYLISAKEGCRDALHHLGYFYDINKDYNHMKKYYLMAIEKGCIMSMNNIGHYYQHVEKNYDQMKKYYLMAIEEDPMEQPLKLLKLHSRVHVMKGLGIYHQNTTYNYDQMQKYYLMAIKKGCTTSMCNLGVYHQNIKNYVQMKKYYLMAIKEGQHGSSQHSSTGCVNAMYNLGYYYENFAQDYDKMVKYYKMASAIGWVDAMYRLAYHYHYTDIDYDLMKKYYLMACNKGDVYAMHSLGLYYKYCEENYDLMEKYWLMAYENNYSIRLDNIFNLDINKYNYIKTNHLQDKYDLAKYILLQQRLIRTGELVIPILRVACMRGPTSQAFDAVGSVLSLYSDLCVTCLK
jgi:TPR repeat protein